MSLASGRHFGYDADGINHRGVLIMRQRVLERMAHKYQEQVDEALRARGDLTEEQIKAGVDKVDVSLVQTAVSKSDPATRAKFDQVCDAAGKPGARLIEWLKMLVNFAESPEGQAVFGIIMQIVLHSMGL